MISSFLSHAQLSAPSAQLPERAEQRELSMGKQRAEHRKLKSGARSRHIFGRNSLEYSFSKIKCFIMNWNIYLD
jgi:hypothetical protein